MIQSMTGYGKATAELSDKKINVEIKSLNSKAMDLSTRIAPSYREKEIEIRNEISKVLERGKVDFSLWIEKKPAVLAIAKPKAVKISGAADTKISPILRGLISPVNGFKKAVLNICP